MPPKSDVLILLKSLFIKQMVTTRKSRLNTLLGLDTSPRHSPCYWKYENDYLKFILNLKYSVADYGIYGQELGGDDSATLSSEAVAPIL